MSTTHQQQASVMEPRNLISISHASDPSFGQSFWCTQAKWIFLFINIQNSIISILGIQESFWDVTCGSLISSSCHFLREFYWEMLRWRPLHWSDTEHVGLSPVYIRLLLSVFWSPNQPLCHKLVFSFKITACQVVPTVSQWQFCNVYSVNWRTSPINVNVIILS